MPEPADAAPPPAPPDEGALVAAYLDEDAESLAEEGGTALSWWAVLLPAPWAMYRKLWTIGALVLVVPILAGLVTGQGLLLYILAGIALARRGRTEAIAAARAAIRRLRRLEPDPERLRARVAAQGGVSLAGAGLGLFAMLAPFLALALAPAAPPSPGPAHEAGFLARAGGLFLALMPGVPIALVLLALSVRRVPLPTLGLALAMGALATLCAMPGAIAEHLIAVVPAPGLRAGLKAFVVAAIAEEAAKLALLWLVVLRHAGARAERDGPLAGACVGLGFALMENALYVVGRPDAATLALARAVTAVPHHVAIGLVMGWCLARRPGERLPPAALLVPVLLHGLYNLPLLLHEGQSLDAILRRPAWGFAFAGLLGLSWLLMRRAVRRPAPASPPMEALDGRNAARTLAAARLVGALVALAAGLVLIGAAAAFPARGSAYALVAVIMPLAFADLAWTAAAREEAMRP